MTDILVVINPTHDGSLDLAAAELIGAASEIGTPVALTVTGNLHWPEEKSRWTPEPDLKAGIWFAREVPRMAAHLGTEPVLVVAREVQGDAQGILPMPLDISGIPNNHLSYAVQWFSFALICFVVTMTLAWRIRRRTI